jgi:amicyanin
MTRSILLRGLFVAASLATVPGVSPGHTADATVTIDNFSFDPPALTVKAGTTVTWRNRDDIPHALASPAKLFKSPPLDTDDKFSFTFASAGSYDYFCSLHPHMTGKVVVEP